MIKSFAETYNATLIIMQNEEHWFHTKEQMRFLDEWISPERILMFFNNLDNEIEMIIHIWYNNDKYFK